MQKLQLKAMRKGVCAESAEKGAMSSHSGFSQHSIEQNQAIMNTVQKEECSDLIIT